MLIFFIPLFIIITKSTENLCISLIEKSQNEEKLTKLLSENLEILINEELKSTPINSCINTLLSSGYFLSLDYYLNELSSKGIAYRETLLFSISNMENKLNSIYNKYRFTDNDYQKVNGIIKTIDNINKLIILENKVKIFFKDIIDIEIKNNLE